ncbi:hypothetical protein BOX15_Mlig027893g1, partial [Macrostomum lignano]
GAPPQAPTSSASSASGAVQAKQHHQHSNKQQHRHQSNHASSSANSSAMDESAVASGTRETEEALVTRSFQRALARLAQIGAGSGSDSGGPAVEEAMRSLEAITASRIFLDGPAAAHLSEHLRQILASCHRQLGQHHCWARRFDLAVRHLSAAVEADPRDIAAAFHLAWSAYLSCDLRLAASALRACLKLNPDHLPALDLSLSVAYCMGEPETWLAACGRLLDRLPSHRRAAFCVAEYLRCAPSASNCLPAGSALAKLAAAIQLKTVDESEWEADRKELMAVRAEHQARTNPQSAEAAAAKPSVPELVPVSPTEASNWTAMAALLEQLCATSTVDDADSWGSCRAYRLIRLVPAALVSESDDQLPAVQDDEASEPPPPPPLATPASSAELASMAKSSTASLGQAFPAELLCSRRSNRLAAASANSASASASGGGDSTAEDSDDDDDELAAAAGSSDAASAAAAVADRLQRLLDASGRCCLPSCVRRLSGVYFARRYCAGRSGDSSDDDNDNDGDCEADAAASAALAAVQLLSPFRLDELLSRLSESAELYTPADAAAVFCGLLAEQFELRWPAELPAAFLRLSGPRLGILAENPNVSVSGLHCLPAESLCLVALAHLELRLDRRRVKDAANWVSTDLSWPNLESLAHSIACLLLRLASPPARLLLRLAWARLRLSAACRRGLDDQAAFGYLAAGLDSPLVSPNSPDWPVVNLAALRRLRRAAKSGREFALASAAARSGNSAAVVAALRPALYARERCSDAASTAEIGAERARQICEMFVSSCYRLGDLAQCYSHGARLLRLLAATDESRPVRASTVAFAFRNLLACQEHLGARPADLAETCAQLAACADLIVRCLRHRVPLTDAEAWIYLHRHFVFLIEETEKQINDTSMDTVHVSAHCVIEAVAEAMEVDSDAAAEKPVLEAGTGQASEAGTGQASEAGTGQASEAGTGQAAEAGTVNASEAGTVNASEAGTVNASEAGTVNASDAGSGQMQVPGEVDEARIRAELRQRQSNLLESAGRLLILAHQLMHETSAAVAAAAAAPSQQPACNAGCQRSNGRLLNYTVASLVPLLLRQQPPPDHPGYLAVDQAFHCLYGLGRRGRYSRRGRIRDHRCGGPPVSIDWETGRHLMRYYLPDKFPEFDSTRLASLPADLERCFDLAAAGLPDRLRVDANAVNDFLFGGVDTLPESNRPLTPDERLTADIHYLLADCCLKSNRFLPAIKHYLRDLALSPDRFDSWAGMALARCSRLQQKLNLQDGSNSSTVSRKYSLACLRSFDQALRINPLCPKLLTERGLFAYELHSHASQLGRRGKQLELAAEWRLPMLRLARESFLQAASAANHPELRDAGEECENWLYNYMLGKCCEKSADHPDICLGYYAAAANELRQSGARYPKRISTSYGSTPRLAVEALEMQYRQLAIVCKQLLMFLPRPKSAVSSPTTASVNLSWIEARLIELSKSAFQRRDALGGGGGEGSKRRHAGGGGGSGRTRASKRARIEDSGCSAAEDSSAHHGGVSAKSQLAEVDSRAEVRQLLNDQLDVVSAVHSLVSGAAGICGESAPRPDELLARRLARCVAMAAEQLADLLARLPHHYKAACLLARLRLRVGKRREARDLLLGPGDPGVGWQRLAHMPCPGLFQDRRPANLFNGVWRLPSDDIDRSGCFAAHMRRALELAIEAADWDRLLPLHTCLRSTENRGCLVDDDLRWLTDRSLAAMADLLADERSPPTVSRAQLLQLMKCRKLASAAAAGGGGVVYDRLLAAAFARCGAAAVRPDRPLLDQALEFCESGGGSL